MAAADTVFSELKGRAGVNKHKILLVDDSSMNRAILSSMEDPAELQERRELLQLPEGGSHHEVLDTSTHLVHQLRFEKAWADSFEKTADRHTFYAKVTRPRWCCPPESAARLGMKKVTTDSLCNEALRETMSRFSADWI